MKLGLALDWAGAEVDLGIDRVRRAERLGYDSVWSAEAYGSDALSPLAYLAGQTDHIRLGTGVVQIGARTPAATAMAAATIDSLAGGGRVILGLGVSGPQIVEGWYGQPWGHPVERMRDYIAIIRKILARDGPVTHDGREIRLPYVGEGATGQGKPLKSILHTNADIPIWLGCGGPASVALMAEVADGWLPMGLTSDNYGTYQPAIEKGVARAAGDRSVDDIEIQLGAHVVVTDDIESAWATRKRLIGFYVGGMGSETHNFHKQSMIRQGYGDEAEKIQALFLAGKREEAFAAVPDRFVDDRGLYGDEARIRERYERYHDSPASGVTIHGADEHVIELMADIAGLEPRP